MAGEKKKTKNKQNFIPVKRTTLQQINYTQQISAPIYTTLDIKHMNRSIELKKQVTTKKSISRKSGCISAKPSVCINTKPVCTSVKATTTSSTNVPTIKYKQLLKKFDQLKGIQQRVERSKSKSMKQFRQKQKSRSPKMKYSNSKKFNLTQLINKHPGTKIHYYTTTTTNHKTEFNSRMSLTNKLEKTLTKINEHQYFDKDSDSSLIPFISTSQAYNNQETKTILNSRCFQMSVQEMDDEDINIGEMRRFCRTLENEELFESSIKRDIGYFRGDRYEMMATKIQRAWRRYCTKRLVDRYADAFLGQFNSNEKPSYILRSQNRDSSSSSLKYYQNKYNINANKQQQMHKEKNKKQSPVYKIDDDISSRIISNTQHQQMQQYSDIDNVNDRTFTQNQEQQQYQEQRQPSNEQEQGEQQENENVLNSSVLYPQHAQLQQERLVTCISNLDEDLQKEPQAQILFKTIEHSQEKHQQSSHSDSQQQQIPQTLKQQHLQQKLTIQYHHINQQSPHNKSHISSTQTDFIMNQVKQNQLKKWNQIVQLLQQNKNKQSQPQHFQSIISQLQQKSSNNKKELQAIITKNRLNDSQQIKKREHYDIEQKPIKKQQKVQQQNKPKRQSSGPSSQLSDLKKQEEFDSRKYIEYLDSDMYYQFDKDKSSQNSQPTSRQDFLNKKISFKKQKQLLAMLDVSQPPLIKSKVFGHSVSKSQNLTYLTEGYDKQQKFPSHPVITKHRLVKSMSEKNIQIVMKSISPQLQYANEHDQLNLQLIRQQFLQSGDTIIQFQKSHTSQQLRLKIKQTIKQHQHHRNNLQNKSQQQQFQPTQPLVRVSIDLSKTFELNNNHTNITQQQQQQLDYDNLLSQEQIQNLPITKNNQPTNYFKSSNKHIYQKQQKISLQPLSSIKTQRQQLQQKSTLVVEQIDQTISSDQDDIEKNQTQAQKQQKMENVSFMIYNTMILQVLRQIASYDSVLQKFKDYSLSVKQAIKQSKKGFQTNHTQVKSYVDGLITYLLNEEPQVFKNLEVPAGPTALQMLHYMHPNQEDDVDQCSSVSQDETSVLVIPNRIFDKYWNLRQKALKFDIESAPHINPQRKKKIVEQLKNLTKMFYRSIFDTFNECLDIERNYGQAGKPYPWKRTAMFPHTKTLGEIQKSIGNAQKRMGEIGTTYCGLIIEKNEMARITLQGSDDYIQHVQQDRMSRMLAQDLIEGEQRWIFYDDQELQLLVEIGNFIVISLIVEATGQLFHLTQHKVE